MRNLRPRLGASALGLLLLIPATAPADTLVVRDGESIQAAVDAAEPGDTILVRRGTYTGMPGYPSVVDVRKDDITIRGSRGAVIDATGFEYGIMVGEPAPITAAGCPPITVTGFALQGLTIQNAENTGVRLVGVDGFLLKGSRYLDNEEYGPFPVCSRDGLIAANFASGHNDAAIYVGDDIDVDVIGNVAVDSVVGAEIENSVGSRVQFNLFAGNSGGLLVFVGPGLPFPFNEDHLVSHNLIVDNNRTNTGSGAVAGVPEGTGILIFGSDRVTVERNLIRGNDSFGLAVTGNFNFLIDGRIEPFNDDLLVRRNLIVDNGASPDPLRSFTPGADVIFLPDVFDPGPFTGVPGTLLAVDPDPTDNCFEDNLIGSDFPPGSVAGFPCP